MARALYVVVDWSHIFETYESLRIVKALAWVPVPTKHDGKSYRRLMAERDGIALYGAWALIVQVASKCTVRGVLADLDGPLDAQDLADKTGAPVRTFERTLEVATSERIGWVRMVTDEGEIHELLEPIREAKSGKPRRRTGHVRDAAGTPADSAESPQNPADSAKRPQIPADSTESPPRPQNPADARTSPQTPAESRPTRARADGQDRTGQDRTGQDRTGHTTPAPEPGASARDALIETTELLTSLFGKKRSRLSQDAEQALARWAPDLPLQRGQVAMLTWFYKLPADAEDFALSRRCGSADALAKNLFGELERAEAYAGKNGGASVGTEKKEKGPAWPEGAREYLAAMYPQVELPARFDELPRDVRDLWTNHALADVGGAA